MTDFQSMRPKPLGKLKIEIAGSSFQYIPSCNWRLCRPDWTFPDNQSIKWHHDYVIMFFGITALSLMHTNKHSVTAPSGFKARWLSVSATTLPQVAKMGKSSRRDLRYRQGYGVGSWKRFFPCDYTEARGPLSPLVYRMGTRTCRLQMRGTFSSQTVTFITKFYFSGLLYWVTLSTTSIVFTWLHLMVILMIYSDPSTFSVEGAHILFSIILQSIYVWL